MTSALSPAQRRLWFLHQLDPANPAYHICVALEVRGPLSLPAMRAAAVAILRRHDALTSTFAQRDGQPVRVPVGAVEAERAEGSGPAYPGGVERVDGGGRAEPACGIEIVDLGVVEVEPGELLERAARRRISLADGPPARWSVLRLAPRRHVVLLTVHHIAFDGGSLPILCSELESLYAAALDGRPAGLALPPPDEPVEVDVDAADLRYWTRQLAGAPPRLAVWSSIPRDGRAKAGSGGRSAAVEAGSSGHLGAVTVGAVVEGATLERLRRVSRERGCTPYMVLAAALATVLARYSGEDDVVLGTPVSARETEASRRRIGLYLNLLPLRLRLHGNPAFERMVGAARDAVLDALQHRNVPFERLVDELRPQRPLDSTPLFQVLFAYQRAAEPPRLPGVSVEVLPSPSPAARYHLTVTATEAPGTLELAFEAEAADCDAASLARFAQHFRHLLDAAAADPSRPVRSLPIMDAAERAALVKAGWGPDPVGSESDVLLHELVERTVARHPDAIAVTDADVQLSYAALDRAASRLADELRTLGAGPERLVAVSLPRSVHLVVALLAVLKTGAGYLPVDPTLPTERQHLILTDATPVTIIDTATAPSAMITGIVSLQAGVERHNGRDQRGKPAGRGRGVAYVLYTSGSSGRPKGVVVEHASAAGFLGWAGREFAGELGGVLATTSIGFDLSVFELFAPLVHGGTAIVAEPGPALATAPHARRATLLNTVPSVLEVMLASRGLPSAVTAVNLAGEQLRRGVVDALAAAAPRAVLRNLYGPSEATTYATFARIPYGGTGQPPIGTAVGGAGVWLVDPDGEPVPPGVTGELVIGGNALARGYLGQPALTASRFVPDHLTGRSGARLYRTGDLAVSTVDGELIFLGRGDNQLKLRGVRIEPEEIEAVLQRHPAVREAAVVPAGTGPHAHLVAFVAGVDARPEDLAEHLRRSLPDVMVPSRWELVDALPRSPNGKLDRHALTIRAGALTARPINTVRPPRSELERAIAHAWCETLALPTVGADQGFFDVGGNSLLLLQLQAALARTAGVEVALVDLFRRPTIASLARLLTERAAQPGVNGETQCGDGGGTGADGSAGTGSDRGELRRAAARAAQRRVAARGQALSTGQGA